MPDAANTQDVAAPQASPDQGDGPSLLDRARELGDHLNVSDIPASAELPRVVGALVAALHADGLKVPDDLFPADEAPAPAAGAPAPAPDPQTSGRLDRLEAALEKIADKLS